MLKLNQKGAVAPLIIVLLLVAGVGLGAYLTRQRTNLLPKAAEPTVARPGDIGGCKVTAKKVTPVRTSDCSKGLYKNISFTCSDNYKYKSLPDNYINGCIGTGDLKKEAEEICNTRSRCEGAVPSPNAALPQPIEGKFYKVTQTQDACAIEQPTSEPVGTYKLSYVESYQHKKDMIRFEVNAKSIDGRGKPIKINYAWMHEYGRCSGYGHLTSGPDILNKNGSASFTTEVALKQYQNTDGNVVRSLYSIDLVPAGVPVEQSKAQINSLLSHVFDLTPFYDYNQKVTAKP